MQALQRVAPRPSSDSPTMILSLLRRCCPCAGNRAPRQPLQPQPQPQPHQPQPQPQPLQPQPPQPPRLLVRCLATKRSASAAASSASSLLVSRLQAPTLILSQSTQSSPPKTAKALRSRPAARDPTNGAAKDTTTDTTTDAAHLEPLAQAAPPAKARRKAKAASPKPAPLELHAADGANVDDNDDAAAAAAAGRLAHQQPDAELPDPVPSHDGSAASAYANQTPLIQEILDIQKQNPDHVLLVQVGSFYEIYDIGGYLDEVASLLGLRIGLQKFRKEPIRVAGFPVFSSRDYVSILLQHGKTVAVVNQTSKDPFSTSKTFRRAVTRVISPGTVLEDDRTVNLVENSFLLSIAFPSYPPPASPAPSLQQSADVIDSLDPPLDAREAPKPETVTSLAPTRAASRKVPVGLAWMDVSTGEFYVAQSELSSLESDLARIQPKEILLADHLRQSLPALTLANIQSRLPKTSLVSYLQSDLFVHPDATARFRNLILQNSPEKAIALGPSRLMDSDSSDGAIFRGYGPAQIEAAAGLLSYVVKCFPRAEPAFRAPMRIQAHRAMRLDTVTLQALEVVRSIRERTTKGSLVNAIDETKTSPGARLLSARLKSPSIDMAEITRRHDLVQVFYDGGADLRASLSTVLAKCSDLNRSLQSLHLGPGSVSDFRNILSTLTHAASIRYILDTHLPTVPESQQPALADLASRVGDFRDLIARFDGFLVETTSSAAAAATSVGAAALGHTSSIGLGVIADGVSDELDAVRRERADLDTERRELQATLSDQYEQTFAFVLDARYGAGLEFPKLNARARASVLAALDSDPDAHLMPRQRTSTSLRIRHDAWTALYSKMMDCDERLGKIEASLFEAACQEIKSHTFRLIAMSEAMAETDVSVALAKTAADKRFVRPVMTDEPVHDVKGGRHPVVEHFQAKRGHLFVKNDMYLGHDDRLWIVTGPNMGGKSTFLRQCAIFSILAQAGSFVPADAAVLGIVDGIFSRIGASDDISANESTFMVEMKETAHILETATPRSLVIMDEVGRGTSTLDGLSLAYAIVRYLLSVNGSRGLFATHYHELAGLVTAEQLAGAACYQAAVTRDDDGNLVCMYAIRRGVMNSSHGIEVAGYAGLPPAVLDLARAVYQRFDGRHFTVPPDALALPTLPLHNPHGTVNQ